MRRLPLWSLGVVNLTVISIGVVAVVQHDSSKYPDKWDPRVTSIASFVEDERDLKFKHPVQVEFLDDATFRKVVVQPDAELSAADKMEIEDTAALFRAVGLLGRNVDLLAAVNRIQEEGVLGLYDPDIERIRVRGTNLTPGVRSTLAHELTHVLQDQYFDLERDREAIDRHDNTESAFRGLAEGDADRIEEAYDETMSEEDQRKADDETSGDRDAVNDVPPIVLAFFAEPYVLGGAFVAYAESAHGADSIDDALRKPPNSEEQFMDPWRYYDGDAPKPVPAVALKAGESAIAALSGEFGAVTWFLILGQHVDHRQALRAVDGWGGDDFKAFRRGGKVCMRARVRGDTPQDTTEIANALGTWVRLSPGLKASTASAGGAVTLETCEGSSTTPTTAGLSSEELLQLLAVRTYFGIGLKSGLGTKTAHCVATRVLEALTLTQAKRFLSGDLDRDQVRALVSAEQPNC